MNMTPEQIAADLEGRIMAIAFDDFAGLPAKTDPFFWRGFWQHRAVVVASQHMFQQDRQRALAREEAFGRGVDCGRRGDPMATCPYTGSAGLELPEFWKAGVSLAQTRMAEKE